MFVVLSKLHSAMTRVTVTITVQGVWEHSSIVAVDGAYLTCLRNKVDEARTLAFCRTYRQHEVHVAHDTRLKPQASSFARQSERRTKYSQSGPSILQRVQISRHAALVLEFEAEVVFTNMIRKETLSNPWVLRYEHRLAPQSSSHDILNQRQHKMNRKLQLPNSHPPIKYLSTWEEDVFEVKFSTPSKVKELEDFKPAASAMRR